MPNRYINKNKINLITNTLDMICALLSIVISVLIIPLSISAKVFISLSDKKAFYSLYLLEKIRLNSGYINLKNKFVIINYSNKKALALRPKKLMPSSEINANIIRFEPLKIKSAVILGDKEFDDVMISFSLNAVHSVAYSVLRELKPYADYRGDVYLSDSGEYGALLELKLGFCILLLLEMIAQKIIGSIIDYAKKKF